MAAPVLLAGLHVRLLQAGFGQSAGVPATLVGMELSSDGGAGAYFVRECQSDSLQEEPVQRVSPNRVELPPGSVVCLGGLSAGPSRLRPLEGRRATLRGSLPDGRRLLAVEGESAFVRLLPRQLLP
ncbi:unnamed protein product [Symbiodinium pilosum]|uniref:Uncharacterized protein n=1 Tax=Symbiodinium pilosum TaxID=2952 RepID=A0A812J1Z8_SYMPI|nr:unnamed protein product [Symbiodinium pilosum]